MSFDAGKIRVNIGLRALIVSVWDSHRMLIFVFFKPVFRM